MPKQIHFTSMLLLAICLLFSCSKKDEANELPSSLNVIPYIELVDIQPIEVQQFQEKIKITLQYEDGDGDLGFLDPDEVAVFVKDSRLSNADAYHLPPLSPVGSNVPITGTVSIELKNTFILGNGTSEQITYQIYLVDRAGNESNVLETPAITITE